MFGQEDEYENENPLSNQQFNLINLRKIKMTLHSNTFNYLNISILLTF